MPNRHHLCHSYFRLFITTRQIVPDYKNEAYHFKKITVRVQSLLTTELSGAHIVGISQVKVIKLVITGAPFSTSTTYLIGLVVNVLWTVWPYIQKMVEYGAAASFVRPNPIIRPSYKLKLNHISYYVPDIATKWIMALELARGGSYSID